MQTINLAKSQVWRAHIASAQKFLGSSEAYCRSVDIPAHVFHYWKKKFSAEDKTKHAVSRFVPVEVTREVTSRFNVLPDPRWLAEFLKHLQGGGAK